MSEHLDWFNDCECPYDQECSCSEHSQSQSAGEKLQQLQADTLIDLKTLKHSGKITGNSYDLIQKCIERLFEAQSYKPTEASPSVDGGRHWAKEYHLLIRRFAEQTKEITRLKGQLELLTNTKLKEHGGEVDIYHILLDGQSKELTSEVERLRAALGNALVTVRRRMKSDETCGHPFDENLGELQQQLEALEGSK